MRSDKTENIPPRFLLFGPAAVSLVIFTQGVTDPVNVTKFFFLGGLAFSLFSTILTRKELANLWVRHKWIVVWLIIFLLASINSVVQSRGPLVQSLYGVYGRNNGFLLYLFLLFSFFAVLTISSNQAFENIVKSLILTGAVNVIYCLWVINFGDFVGWHNPYGNILGTFGNPNFIGAFLGMFSSVLISILFQFWRSKKVAIPTSLTLGICLLEIYRSNAIQGRVLFLAGCALNILMYLWFARKSIWIFAAILVGSVAAGVLGVLGALQVGPLSSLVYKESVSLRGQYWFAGFQMGKNNLLSGVGFDSYGDWYRFSRKSSALIRPGVDTVSNTAHNVFIDLFAFGGAPLIAAYLVINFYVAVSIMRVIRRRKKFDFIFVSLAGAWICYQLQSIISINQIGLALWGWILGAALIAYEKNGKNFDLNNPESRKNYKALTIISPSLRAGLGLVVGLLVAVPPLSADMKWRSAQISRDASQLEVSLKSTYMNPSNSYRFLNSVGAFHDSGLDELAHKYAIEAVRYNPYNFELWRMFTYIRASSPEEREKAISKMRAIDPLNKNLDVGSK